MPTDLTPARALSPARAERSSAERRRGRYGRLIKERADPFGSAGEGAKRRIGGLCRCTTRRSISRSIRDAYAQKDSEKKMFVWKSKSRAFPDRSVGVSDSPQAYPAHASRGKTSK
eukprot:364304-Chlamydomonas_euryale.AAC.3